MVTAALEWLPSNESGRLDYEAQAIALDDFEAPAPTAPRLLLGPGEASVSRPPPVRLGLVSMKEGWLSIAFVVWA